MSHTLGNVTIDQLSDFGRILKGFDWHNQPQDARDPMYTYGYTGLVIDQDNYIHTPGAENIADSYRQWPYVVQDDLTFVSDGTMIIDNEMEQKSVAAFQNTGAGTGDPNDILVNQTAWTVANRNWAIIQWSLLNMKTVPITNVSIGLELLLSMEEAQWGVGGDGGDDIDGYNATHAVYWARDDSGVTVGFGSAVISDPITHYHSVDYNTTYTYDQYKFLYENDPWLYNRLHAPNGTAGTTPGNRSSTVGWKDFTLPAGSSRNVNLIVAVDNTFDDMITSFKDAQYYYNYIATGFLITEFSDASSETQKIEVFNNGRDATDLAAEGYNLSVDGGLTPLTGDWSPEVIPANGYSVFTLSAGSIGPEGGKIGLYQNLGGGNRILFDEVSFGHKGPAPDPLIGESVARRYDATIVDFADEWLRNASSGPTWGAPNDVGDIVSLPWVVLNSVMFNPINAVEGYVELIYKGPGSLDISGYRLVCDNEFIVPPGTILNKTHRYYILKQEDLPAFFTNMTASKDNVYLYDNNGNRVDMVGWNSPHLQGMTVRRIPDGNGTFQGYNDTTSEAAGWFFNTPLKVFMTEISDSESAVAQIEIYNPSFLTINFTSGFTFESGSGPLAGVWSVPKADSGEYAVFNVSTPYGLDSEGDTISFAQNGILIEEISYGQKGTVPDPLPDESVERTLESGYYTDMWSRNQTSGPTFGAHNDAPPPNLSSSLVLNEVMFNPGAPENGFVELFLRGVWLNISGYKIVGDTEYIVPDGTELTSADEFFYLIRSKDTDFFDVLNPSGDNVYIYDDKGSLMDMAGWSSLHLQGTSMCRIPNGNGTRDGFDDISSTAAGWVFGCAPTVQLIKISTEVDTLYGNISDVIQFNLTVTNKQSLNDTVLISNSTVNGYTVEIFDETATSQITDIFVPTGSSVNITVMVTPLSSFMDPSFYWDKITIIIQSENNTMFWDSGILTVYITPFIWPRKYALPNEIYLNGTGHDEISTIVLNLAGMGYVTESIQWSDVIFCVDTSGSMSLEAIASIKKGLTGFVDGMRGGDFGAVVVFSDNAALMNPLTGNHTQLKEDIAAIPGPNGLTNMVKGLNISINELLGNETPGNFVNKTNNKVIILLSDGSPTTGGGYDEVLAEADIAAANNITIYTIGLELLNDSLAEDLLKEIANKTGGQYLYADSPDVIPEIYWHIAGFINSDIAGRDTDIYDAVPMVRDVLPPWIDLVEGSFSKDPDVNYINETGYRILEWNISAIRIDENWEVMFQIKSNEIGWVRSNDLNTSRVYYRNCYDNDIFVLFPESLLHVLPPPPQPPTLYIDVSPNGNNTILYWDPPATPGITHYLIYRSTSQTDFDFNSVWVNTSSDKETGEPETIPLRRMWNDTGAASMLAPQEFYYVIRAVNNLSEVSSTSRTVGKWTKSFSQGVSTFSLPLEPIDPLFTDNLTLSMNAVHIKYMDPATHMWIQHDFGEGNTHNVEMKLGEGYEVKFASQTNYTFCGMPGAMISYDDDNGFSGFDPNSNAKNLTVSVEPDGDVNLTWQEPASMGAGDCYEVYYSNSRDGFFRTLGIHYDLACPPVNYGTNTTTIAGLGASNPAARLYFMVVTMNASGIRGTSTYSIGIWTEEYLA
ncbi:MAG: VWA domain-containing protein, partial [Thermoplasmata archaeon]